MESIRKLQFMVKGYRNFTKRNKKLPKLQGSLKGYNFVITGANSGIGLTAAINAAQKGAQVYIICRNQQRGNEAVIKIKQKSKNQNVNLILGQMNEKKDLEGVFNRLKQKIKQIDILVHNAGCMLHKRQFNSDKIQKNYACNTFSVFYLTHLCLPLLHDKSKIITVSSGGMLTQKLQTIDLFMEKIEFDGTTQYARNKRQQICIMQEFAKLYPNKGKFVSMHPGWVDTLAVRTSMPDFYNKMKDDLKDEEEGADTIIYLSLLDYDKIKNGEFYYDRQVVDKHLTISCTTYESKEAEKMMNILRKQAEIQ